MSAPYSFSLSLTDDTTFGWAVDVILPEGETFPWEGTRSEYSIRDDCGSVVLRVTSGEWPGLMNDAEANRVLCKLPDLQLRPGVYRHGLRMVNDDMQATFQFFDGTITVTEGNI